MLTSQSELRLFGLRYRAIFAGLAAAAAVLIVLELPKGSYMPHFIETPQIVGAAPFQEPLPQAPVRRYNNKAYFGGKSGTP